MTAVLRLVAAAAALVSLTANAAFVLTFEEGPLYDGADVPSSYQTDFGVVISPNGKVYNTKPYPIDGNSKGHLGNVEADQVVTLDLTGPSIYNELSFNFSYSCTNGQFKVAVFGQPSETATKEWECTKSGDFTPWAFADLDLNSISKISSVAFEFTSNSGVLGVDNLNFDTRPTGNVPEPASYALVALALGAAGVASRSRRRA